MFISKFFLINFYSSHDFKHSNLINHQLWGGRVSNFAHKYLCVSGSVWKMLILCVGDDKFLTTRTKFSLTFFFAFFDSFYCKISPRLGDNSKPIWKFTVEIFWGEPQRMRPRILWYPINQKFQISDDFQFFSTVVRLMKFFFPRKTVVATINFFRG